MNAAQEKHASWLSGRRHRRAGVAGLSATVLAGLLTAFAASAVMSSHAATPAPASVPATPEATSFQWSDERPEKDRASTMDRDTLGVTTRMGDAALPRPPADLVRAWLQDRAGSALSGKTVTLSGFEVEVFEAAAGNRSLFGPAPKPIVITPDILGSLAGNLIVRLIGERSTNTLVSSRIEAIVDGRKIVGLSRETVSRRLVPADMDQVIQASLEDLCAEALNLGTTD